MRRWAQGACAGPHVSWLAIAHTDPPLTQPLAGGTAAGAYGSSQAVKDLLGGLFHYVAVEPPPEHEQQRILARLHPALAPLLPHAMDTLALVRCAYGQLPRGRAGEPALSEAAAAALAAGGLVEATWLEPLPQAAWDGARIAQVRGGRVPYTCV